MGRFVYTESVMVRSVLSSLLIGEDREGDGISNGQLS